MNISQENDVTALPHRRRSNSMLGLRVLSSAIILPPVIAAIWYGGVFYSVLLAFFGAGMLLELSGLFSFRWAWMKYVLAAAAAGLPVAFEFLGAAVCGLIIVCLAALFLFPSEQRDSLGTRLIFAIAALLAFAALLSLFLIRESAGSHPVFFLVAVIAGTDIGGYFTGKSIGGPKLAPRISPNKTWSGLIGGTALAGLFGTLLFMSPLSLLIIDEETNQTKLTIFVIIALSALFAAVAQAGDLFESWLKRKRDVKNSGRLIPGHGGLLDRVDGYLTVAPLAALILLMHKWGYIAWP